MLLIIINCNNDYKILHLFVIIIFMKLWCVKNKIYLSFIKKLFYLLVVILFTESNYIKNKNNTTH